MIGTGLCSKVLSTFSPKEIIEMCVHSHIRRIEWDSCHAPYDNYELIKDIERQCRLNLILPIAYNTNLIITGKENIYDEFERICECAKTLRAPAVNIIIGTIDSSTESYNALVSEVKNLCKIAQTLIVNIIPGRNSFVCDADKALTFLSDVYMTNLKLYWAPNTLRTASENKKVIQQVVKYTTNIYISNKTSDGNVLPLKDAKDLWRDYGGVVANDRSRLHLFLLDRLPVSDEDTLTREFSSLRYILAKV